MADDIKIMSMELPVLDGIIDRRLLINYRVKPEVVKNLLPDGLEPLTINGYASAGICLLRLKHIGIKHTPRLLRINSENAAHRFLVHDRNTNLYGVYIPRRDTDSVMNVIVAGKLFSWPHYLARFEVNEANDVYAVTMESEDGHSSLQVEAELADSFPTDSMFGSLGYASECFRECSTGISPSSHQKRNKIIQLNTSTWTVKCLHVRHLRSSFFEERTIFPEGSICFDNALLMEGIAHEWISKHPA